MPIMNLIVGMIAGVAWLVACCVFIHKTGEKKKRIPLYVVSAILFIVFAGVFAGARIGAVIGELVLHEKAALLNEYVTKNHNDIRLVRNGVDASEVPQAIDELETLIPRKISEFGLSGIIMEGMYKKTLSKGFDMLRSKTDLIVNFADENGKVTSSTIIQALEWGINSIIRNIVFYSTLVVSVILAVYLCVCIILALKSAHKAPHGTA